MSLNSPAELTVQCLAAYQTKEATVKTLNLGQQFKEVCTLFIFSIEINFVRRKPVPALIGCPVPPHPVLQQLKDTPVGTANS
jgi:hypothetical protein